jgi:hypothetical protein
MIISVSIYDPAKSPFKKEAAHLKLYDTLVHTVLRP